VQAMHEIEKNLKESSLADPALLTNPFYYPLGAEFSFFNFTGDANL